MLGGQKPGRRVLTRLTTDSSEKSVILSSEEMMRIAALRLPSSIFDVTAKANDASGSRL